MTKITEITKSDLGRRVSEKTAGAVERTYGTVEGTSYLKDRFFFKPDGATRAHNTHVSFFRWED